eukprot:CAMPEP_0168334640 /NCGR_PEP_ID=MMETSP0213-20121227/10402_1 /TAXON_ID=151035 /ORGANISM="Euplotes harpa, Strain FSP1.4" /LENGTH=74 /DNA_ID=CAMNT_0008339351 /DNA_START=47 /DNA_END=271 /DNA_ORIENTATION=+
MPKFKKPTEKQIKEVFNHFDADGSGGISASEIKEVLEALGMQTTETAIKELLEAADSDGSGFIEYDEFKRAVLS